MLILSRRAGQALRIGDAIRVAVISVDGQFVRLGLDAPASYKILREELWTSIAAENKEAIATTAATPTTSQVLAQMLQPRQP